MVGRLLYQLQKDTSLEILHSYSWLLLNSAWSTKSNLISSIQLIPMEGWVDVSQRLLVIILDSRPFDAIPLIHSGKQLRMPPIHNVNDYPFQIQDLFAATVYVILSVCYDSAYISNTFVMLS